MSVPEMNKTIVIKNVYYMMSYAFRVLKQTNYEYVAKEEFEDAADLLAAILAKGVAQQIKQGLHREYVDKHETLPFIRGKLNLPGTIRNRIRRNPNAACEFDELSEDNLLNRILKTTMTALLRTEGVKKERKDALKKNLVFFDGVGEFLSIESPWRRIQYQRNNRNYEMLIHLCSMILDGMIQTAEHGKYRLAVFEEKYMPWLYENFILEYYRVHRPDLNPAHTKISWDYRGGKDDIGKEFMPAMKTDISLRKGKITLIIDAKYYGHILKASHQNAEPKLPSANLYQIFAYVKNYEKRIADSDTDEEVSGLLLYAKTNELNVPFCQCNIGGNRIGAQTLDLNCDFKTIRGQLDGIANKIFGPLSSGAT